MDTQQELSLEAVNSPLHETQEPEPMKVGKQILQHIEKQTPAVWCGGVGGKCHDVTVILVPGELNLKMNEGSEHQRENLTLLKVHSGYLSRCSKYFETCLNERWMNPNTTSDSLEFVLETQTAIECYTDCFSRMYKPAFLKDFKDVKYSLELLKVASQIQFQELMDSILLYLSSKVWVDMDATMIRLYSASLDFPRKHAQDLVVRLGMEESNEECHKQLCGVVEQCIRTALGRDGNFRSHRALIKEMLPDIAVNNGPGSGRSADSYVTRDVVMIVSRETKDMLVNIEKECDGQTYSSVPRFAEKVLAICWILETLLVAKVAEEVVQSFSHLHAFPRVLAINIPRDMYLHESRAQYLGNTLVQTGARDAAVELGKVVVQMYQEVAAGNLLSKTPERVALLRNWHSLLKKLCLSNKDSLDHAAKDLFSTLPLKQQMVLLKSRSRDINYEDYIDTDSLAKLLKEKWPALESEVCCIPSVKLSIGSCSSL